MVLDALWFRPRAPSPELTPMLPGACPRSQVHGASTCDHSYSFSPGRHRTGLFIIIVLIFLSDVRGEPEDTRIDTAMQMYFDFHPEFAPGDHNEGFVKELVEKHLKRRNAQEFKDLLAAMHEEPDYQRLLSIFQEHAQQSRSRSRVRSRSRSRVQSRARSRLRRSQRRRTFSRGRSSSTSGTSLRSRSRSRVRSRAPSRSRSRIGKRRSHLISHEQVVEKARLAAAAETRLAKAKPSNEQQATEKDMPAGTMKTLLRKFGNEQATEKDRLAATAESRLAKGKPSTEKAEEKNKLAATAEARHVKGKPQAKEKSAAAESRHAKEKSSTKPSKEAKLKPRGSICFSSKARGSISEDLKAEKGSIIKMLLSEGSGSAGSRSTGSSASSSDSLPPEEDFEQDHEAWLLRHCWACTSCGCINKRFTQWCECGMQREADPDWKWKKNDGDWTCPQCGNLNFKRRRWCVWSDCPSGDWQCVCGNVNWSRRRFCNRRTCQMPRPW